MKTNILNHPQLQQQLPNNEIRYFAEIDSTNEYLLTHSLTLPQGTLCIAETQTAGRGRRGRQWHSPNQQNLYLSLLWKYSKDNIQQYSTLSLVVALSIVEVLQSFGIQPLHIKWPNDVYYQHKKVGGILIENRITPHEIHLIIGIGLNIAMQADSQHNITQPWATLATYQLNRENVITALIQQLNTVYQTYPHTGFAPYLARWQQFDLYANQPVKLITDQQTIEGIARGINETGEIILEINPFH